MAARVNDFGWHVQLQMNGREFPERQALLKRLPCDLVVDHESTRYRILVDNPAEL
jgi:D-galactarolactone isomerase